MEKIETLESELKRERTLNHEIARESRALRERIKELDTDKLLQEPRRARRTTALVKEWEACQCGKQGPSKMPLDVDRRRTSTALTRERESMFVSLSYTRLDKEKKRSEER